jgi:CBS domain-containing protein
MVLTISKEVNRAFSAADSGNPFSSGVARGCCWVLRRWRSKSQAPELFCLSRPDCRMFFEAWQLSDMDVSGTIGAVLNQKSREIYSVSPDATVFEAVQLMDTKNVGALLVMDGQRLVGIISERDYTRKIMLRGKRSRETKVAEIMSANVFTTHRREGVETCLRLMTDQHIRHLPVLDDDNVVGVISIGDLVKHVISCQQAAIAHLESYIHGGFIAG